MREARTIPGSGNVDPRPGGPQMAAGVSHAKNGTRQTCTPTPESESESQAFGHSPRLGSERSRRIDSTGRRRDVLQTVPGHQEDNPLVPVHKAVSERHF